MEDKIKMNKKIILRSLVVLGVLMCTNMASAYLYPAAPHTNGLQYGQAGYGSWPVNSAVTGRYYPYAQTPVRVGGFYGQNSFNIIGLRPGVYNGPVWDYQTRRALSNQYYQSARVGGRYFGNRPYWGYSTLRAGTFVFDGAGTGYNMPNYYYGGSM